MKDLILFFVLTFSAFTVVHANPQQARLLSPHGEFMPIERVPQTPFFRGARPLSAEDYELLRSYGIKTILNLGVFPWEKADEYLMAARYGIQVISVTILPSPFSPLEKTVTYALQVLKDHKHEPLYIHCRYGRDRTSLVVGLYQLTEQNRDLRSTWESMKYYGFTKNIHIRGLYNYFYYYNLLRVPPEHADFVDRTLKNTSICDGQDLSKIRSERQCLENVKSDLGATSN